MASHLNEEADELEIDLGVASEGDAEGDESDDEEDLARQLLETESRRDQQDRDRRKGLCVSENESVPGGDSSSDTAW